MRAGIAVDVGLVEAFADHLPFIHDNAADRAASRCGISFLRLPESALHPVNIHIIRFRAGSVILNTGFLARGQIATGHFGCLSSSYLSLGWERWRYLSPRTVRPAKVSTARPSRWLRM